MATRSIAASTADAEPCLLAVAEPPCGEEIRRLLRRLCPGRRHPTGLPSRRRLPAFAACPEALPRLLEHPCVAAIVEATCKPGGRGEKPPVSYVVVGRAVIVSLDERLRGREREVAEQLLRAVPGAAAVYGKTATLGDYRVQELVLLAGRPLEETIHVENGLRFPVPLGRVYANPRLAGEHMRVARMVRSGERVLDMFSGIGGFAVTIAALGRAEVVVANDLNPHAAAAAARALVLNRSRIRSPVLVLNTDARHLPDILQPVFTRIIMNLPHGAKQFLPKAAQLCSPRGCTVHLYAVARSPQEAAEGLPPGFTLLAVTRVLDYAPGKYIFRLDLEYHKEG
jgi:tRNA (guanine37-N1)-methyltransferase